MLYHQVSNSEKTLDSFDIDNKGNNDTYSSRCRADSSLPSKHRQNLIFRSQQSSSLAPALLDDSEHQGWMYSHGPTSICTSIPTLHLIFLLPCFAFASASIQSWWQEHHNAWGTRNMAIPLPHLWHPHLARSLLCAGLPSAQKHRLPNTCT